MIKSLFNVVIIVVVFVCVTAVWAQQVVPVRITDGTKTLVFNVEVAANDETRKNGLMGRESLAHNAGMLFVWPRSFFVTMWMKDTPLSLDILFIEDYKVVGIVEYTAPESEELLNVGQKSNAVLEVPAGTVSANNITVGWKVIW